MVDDINDTLDMVYSRRRPLLPTVKKGACDRVLGYDPAAVENWQRYDPNNMIDQAPAPCKGVALMINCDKDDEFGLAGATEKLHSSLRARNVKHAYELYPTPWLRFHPISSA